MRSEFNFYARCCSNGNIYNKFVHIVRDVFPHSISRCEHKGKKVLRVLYGCIGSKDVPKKSSQKKILGNLFFRDLSKSA